MAYNNVIFLSLFSTEIAPNTSIKNKTKDKNKQSLFKVSKVCKACHDMI